MMLTTEWGRFLRGVTSALFLVCALAWAGESANATPLPPVLLTPGGLAKVGSGYAMSSSPTGGTQATESPSLQLTASPYTVQTGGPTLTTTVEKGDTQNPYYNAVTSPNVLSFIFQISNPSTSNGIGYLSANGFDSYSGLTVSYATYTTSSGLTPSPLVQMTVSGVVDLPYVTTTFEAPSGSTPKVSAEVVLYTNATSYGPALDPVTWGLVGSGMGAIYSASSYMPTPEPSSLILASIGMLFFLGLGWRKRRASA